VSATDGPRLDAQRQRTPPPILDSIAGSDSFRFYCASCHGITGSGDGRVASALKTRPPDLTALARHNGGTFPRDRVPDIVTGTAGPLAAHGTRDMPVWGGAFWALDPSEPRVRLRIERIVGHVESLQVPSSTPGRSGAQLFRVYCATCHGLDAHGGGPLAGSLRRVPPDLTNYTERNNGVFPSERLSRIIDGRDVLSHGDREMPVWGDAFRSEPHGLTADEAKARIDAIVGYLRAIQRRDAD
jgi:mono/diheme cytochrome c family protein